LGTVFAWVLGFAAIMVGKVRSHLLHAPLQQREHHPAVAVRQHSHVVKDKTAAELRDRLSRTHGRLRELIPTLD
jgi:uncharacterized protein YpbB